MAIFEQKHFTNYWRVWGVVGSVPYRTLPYLRGEQPAKQATQRWGRFEVRPSAHPYV